MLYEITKRLIDVVGALVALVILSPVFLILAVAIKWDSPGPVFYVQERVTRRGQLFKIIKFRSMKLEYSTGAQYGGAEADKFLQEVLNDPKNKEEWKKLYKLSHDPRVTRVGKFLRKTSLDETPQFWNVLTGTMSLVGPRAYLAHELLTQMEVYPSIKPHIKQLLTAKPGITGPWQIGGRSKVKFDERVEMDAQYAIRRSIRYDALVLLKTPVAVLTGRGAV
jgi:lipopolysaccharide/colanic/teichoic acid biosynthesis glycosyltransferase